MDELTTPAEEPLRLLTAQEFIEILEGKKLDIEEYSTFYVNYDIIGLQNSPFNRLFDSGVHVFISGVRVNEIIRIDESFVAPFPVSILGGKFIGAIEINGGVFEKKIMIAGGDFIGGIIMFSGSFKNDLRIIGGKYETAFQVAEVNFFGEFKIEGGVFSGPFWIKGGLFSKGIQIYNGFFSNIDLRSNRLQNIVINDAVILRLIFPNEIQRDAVWQISAAVKTVEMHNFNNFGYIQFNGVRAAPSHKLNDVGEELPIQATQINGWRKYWNVVRNTFRHLCRHQIGNWVIRNSTLGKTEFIGCDLSSFVLQFENSKLMEIFLAGTIMPHRIDLPEDSAADLYEQQRLGYAQIKKINEARGDTLEANRYLAKEMGAYFKQLIGPGLSLKGIGRFMLNLPEIFTLGLNFLSSNFGQWWFLALVTTLVVSFLSLEWFLRSVGLPASFQVLPPRWYSDIFEYDRLRYFWEYLLPLTKIEFLEGECLPKGTNYTTESRTIFYVSKYVVIPYFIYQFIQAFRKHGKKGG